MIKMIASALLLILLAATRPCQALEAASAVDDLIGEWAPDCGREMSEDNVHIEFRRENDVVVRLARGSRQRSITVVRSAAAETGLIHLAFGPPDRDMVRVDAEYVVDTSMRTLESVWLRQGQPDLVAVSGGRLSADGRPSQTLYKCHPNLS